MAPRLVWYSLPPLPSASPSSPATHLAPVRCWSKEDGLAILEGGGEEASSVHVLFFGAMVASPQGGCVEKRWRRRPGVKKTCQKSQNRKIAQKIIWQKYYWSQNAEMFHNLSLHYFLQMLIYKDLAISKKRIKVVPSRQEHEQNRPFHGLGFAM